MNMVPVMRQTLVNWWGVDGLAAGCALMAG
jgi:hypothetical protein